VLVSSCPLVLDESGGAFTPIDSMVFPPDDRPAFISWEYYLKMYKISVGTGRLLPLLWDATGYVNDEAAVFTENSWDILMECLDEGGDSCLSYMGIMVGRAETFYTEPTKSDYLDLFAPLVDQDAAVIQNVLTSLIDEE